MQEKKVILAPNAFKGSLTATDFCRIVAEELQSAGYCPVCLPMCDGGDGTAGILACYRHALPQTCLTVDALGREHRATFYTEDNTALVDLAACCGLKHLKPAEYDVMNANTAGLGKVLLEIVHQGITKIILGVGGSASIDGGTGALEEMGMNIRKDPTPYRNHLIEIKEIDTTNLKKNFKDTEILLLCDVTNPLCGKNGAAAVFGPQKGATPSQTGLLENHLRNYATLLAPHARAIDPLTVEGGGAAGGIAAAFSSLLGAKLVSGADYCLQISGFGQWIHEAGFVITGEGKLDSQSLQGKLPGVIASRCNEAKIPVVAIAGCAELPLPGFQNVYTLMQYASSLEDSIRHPEPYLRRACYDLIREIPKIL